MKKIILLFFFLSSCLATLEIHAQTICKTPEYDSEKEISFRKLLKNQRVQSTYCLKIEVHVIRRSNGTGGQTPQKVTNAINILKADFLPHEITFNYDNSIDYIDDDGHFNNPSDNIFAVNSHTDAIDIYLFDDNGASFGQASVNTEETALLISGEYDRRPPFPPYVETSVISHEMGHVLNLLHTHAGCNNPSSYSPPNNTNCTNRGDYVCDTPPDPNMDNWVDYPQCEWLEQTFCSDFLTYNEILEYNPDESNIMAYTHPFCMQYFTSGQGQRMREAIATLPLLISVTDQCLDIECRTGSITVNDFFVNCPDFPLEVTGTFQLPTNGQFVSLDLNLLQGNSNIGTNITPIIDYSTNTYSFSINDTAIFGSPPSGNNEVEVVVIYGDSNGYECRAFKTNTVLSPQAAISFNNCNTNYPCSSLENTLINGTILTWPDLDASTYYIDIMPNSLCCNENDSSVFGPMTTAEVSTNEFDLSLMPNKCSMVRVYTKDCPPTAWCCVKPSFGPSFIFPYGNDCLPPNSIVSGAKIVINPNPATNKLVVSIDTLKLSSIALYDIYGGNIRLYENLNLLEKEIDVSNLARGFYIIKVVLEDGTSQVKNVIVK